MNEIWLKKDNSAISKLNLKKSVRIAAEENLQNILLPSIHIMSRGTHGNVNCIYPSWIPVRIYVLAMRPELTCIHILSRYLLSRQCPLWYRYNLFSGWILIIDLVLLCHLLVRRQYFQWFFVFHKEELINFHHYCWKLLHKDSSV